MGPTAEAIIMAYGDEIKYALCVFSFGVMVGLCLPLYGAYRLVSAAFS